jgi:mRNA interferase MazF
VAYFKNFDAWNEVKKKIDKIVGYQLCNEGEIWWCAWGVNIDVEMDGKNDVFDRPVVILKKFNYRSSLVVPLNSVFKDNVYTYQLESHPSCVSISQMRCISNKRLLRKLPNTITEKELAHIIIRIKYLISYK